MKIKSKSKKCLASETVAMAEITDVKFLPDENKPEKCVLSFKIPNHAETLSKEYPPNLDENSPLRRDVQSVLGRTLTTEELEDGYDPKDLAQKKVPVVVMHKAGAGGKLQPVIGPIFSVKKIKEAVAALEG
jgi:hypothetical protein